MSPSSKLPLKKGVFHTGAHHEETLESCVRSRHSIRAFLDKEVDPNIIQACLRLAQLAPSNSNIQNWRLFIASGPAKDRIVNALYAEAQEHGPNIGPIPDRYKIHRSELGRELYGPDGYDIARSEKEKHRKAVLRNYQFFGAPVIGIVVQDKSLGAVDGLSTGMFLQTFALALTEQGLGTCWQQSVAGYPELLAKEFGCPADHQILCGVAIGWPDPESKLNKLNTGRSDVEKHVTWLHD